ncbi:MAG: DNA repair protein RecN [Erysipelotrichaceae bacterium]|nr:DNA repair protein RecN [Erysipelotrichaceae bacterium]
MLKRLTVKNFAIIEDIDITLDNGLTVLTGETGAGKSLIIDTIELLLGERASTEMIRNGKEKAEIIGYFSVKNPRISGILSNLDIDFLDDQIIISRTISPNKNIIKINDKTVTLSELKSLSKYLADIHQQFDMVKLLNKDNYLEIIDGFKYELVNEYKTNYLNELETLKKANEEYQNLVKKIKDIKDKRDIYEYELKEISSLNLSKDEEEDIASRIELLKNYDKIYALLEESKELIDKESLEDIYNIKENISKLSEYQNEYVETANKLNDYYYELEDIYNDIKHKLSHLDYNPDELDELETRSNAINQVKKKYGKSVIELLQYQNELKTLLQDDVDLDTSLEEERKKLSVQYDKTYNSAKELSELRKQIAKSISNELVNNMADLALKVKLNIEVTTSNKDKDLSLSIFTNEGIDEVEFYIETNIGEGMKPLAKVVSGGEMSRIMLAIKALFIKSQKISTVVFDEVDTGISGEIASKVARKIKEISLSTQVISITHLPQVASLSNHHLKISKQVKDGRTYTSIKKLTLDEKIYEVASMISGGKVTNSQLEYAKEMILNQ